MKLEVEIPRGETAKMVRKIARYSEAKSDLVRALIESTATAISEDAARRVPVQTGTLRDSITVVLEDVARAPSARVGFKGQGRYYAHLVELGSSNAAAQPFLVPAFETHMPRFHRELKRIYSTL